MAGPLSETGAAATPVEVVIVNYNAGATILDCLQSVHGQGVPVSITVVDNASSDGSAEALAARFADREDFRLLRNPDNPGFAAAVNRALDPVRGRRLLILNPDCELRPGALPALLDALDGDARAGLAAPAVTGPGGELQRATLRRFPDPWRSFVTFSGLWRLGRRWPLFRGVEVERAPPAESCVADAVSGACMLVRRGAFEQAGRMDPAYRLHCEDLDLMYRLRQNGWHCLYVPSARAVHRQGLSSASRPLWVHWQKHRGMQRFYLKYQAVAHPWPLRWLVRLGIWLRFAVTAPLQWLRR